MSLTLSHDGNVIGGTFYYDPQAGLMAVAFEVFNRELVYYSSGFWSRRDVESIEFKLWRKVNGSWIYQHGHSEGYQSRWDEMIWWRP